MSLTPAQARDKLVKTANAIVRLANKAQNPASVEQLLDSHINLLIKQKQDLVNTLWKYLGTNLRKR